ncbi:MAG: host-nuclease inhibitor Gam family protein [Spirochaetales bacterium]
MTALMERQAVSLPSFIYGEPPEATEDHFIVDDERKASWAANKVLTIRRRMEARSKLAESYQMRILDWLQQTNATDEKSAEFLEGSLRPWVEKEVAQLGKTRHISLPGARVGLRKNPAKVAIVDQVQALGFCIENLEEAVVVKRELSKAELKKHLIQGARIPGAELVPGQDELTVTAE